jgi:hypothetical protein
VVQQGSGDGRGAAGRAGAAGAAAGTAGATAGRAPPPGGQQGPAAAAQDQPIRHDPGDPAAPGLEGVPRSDIGALEAALPSLVERAVRGPLVLTRHGEDAFVLLPLDLWRRYWFSTPRPPVFDPSA